MRHKIQFLLIGLLTLLVLSACEDKVGSDSTLVVDPEVLHFDAAGGTATFRVTSTTAWRLTTEEPNAWIQPREGSAGTTEVQVGIANSNSNTMKYFVIMVQTTDGSVTRNVRVEQAGVLVDDAFLDVTNHADLLFGGQVGDTELLMIQSNVAWRLTGPSWLEVMTSENQYTALSESVPISGTGNVDLYIRTRQSQTDEYDREGKIVLTEAYEAKVTQELKVTQLGRHRVSPDVVVPLAHYFGISWKCGMDVVKFYFHVGEQQHVGTTPNFSDWGESSADNVNSWAGLNANTEYYIGTVGVDANGQAPYIYDNVYMTKSDQNQALAAISDLSNDGTKWTWKVTPNELTNVYFIWVDDQYVKYNDGIVAWFFHDLMHNEEEKFPVYQGNTSWSLPGTSDMQVVTWASPRNSNVLAGIIGRKSGSVSSNAKSMNPWGPEQEQATVNAVPKADLRNKKLIKNIYKIR